MTLRPLSVVIAVQHAQANLAQILHRLAAEPEGDVEIVVCHTAVDTDVPRLVQGHPRARALLSPPGSLIPHLWRDGILAARHAAVAVTTAHCLPAEGWLGRLRAADLASHAGVGGVFENAPDADAKAWAIFLQRYLPYAPPQAARTVRDIAADNAVYRREELLRHEALLNEGFWEPEFHARFRLAGLTLALDPSIVVVHANRYSAHQFFAQRFAHGTQFGLARGRTLGIARRCLLLALSPLLPFLFLRKIATAAWRHPLHRARLLPSLPWLGFFLVAWGMGEARGYLESLTEP